MCVCVGGGGVTWMNGVLILIGHLPIFAGPPTHWLSLTTSRLSSDIVCVEILPRSKWLNKKDANVLAFEEYVCADSER